MEAPTEAETGLIRQLRDRLSDLNLESDERYQSDMFYVRWIRARNKNVDQAETMLRKSMEWRKSYDMDSILDWTPPELLLTEVVIEFLGYSNNNCATFFVPFGCCDFKRVCNLGLKDDCIKYFLQMFERAMLMSNGCGRNGETAKGQVLLLGDFKDFSIATMLYPSVIDLVLQIAKLFEANFPETMFKFFFYNSGRALQIALNVCKPIVAPRTLEKIETYTEPVYLLFDKIHALFPEEELPPFFGGPNWKIEDQILSKYPSFGATRRKALSDFQAAFKAETATVAAGDQLFLEFGVQLAGSKVRYEVSVVKYDIDFIILKGTKEVLPKTRICSKSDSNSGEIVCDKPGVLIVSFDNSYSKYRSKEVQFKIHLIEPTHV